MSKPLTFVLSDESLNRHGFRVLTNGIDLTSFLANPIMLYMHKRDSRYNEHNSLPIGTWTNIRKENGKLMADANFDMDDQEAVKIKNKVEKGILRMASISLETIELSEAPENIVQGQSRATVTKSEIIEASIVDIGSNKNALRLYKSGEFIELSADNLNAHIPEINLNQNSKKMKKIAILLSLAEGADELAVENAVKDLLQKNQTYVNDLAAKDAKIVELQGQIDAQSKLRVKSLIDKAIELKKITEAERPQWEDLANTNFELAEKTLGNIQGVERIADKINNPPAGNAEKLNWDEMHKAGTLEKLKAENLAAFKELYKNKYGKEYKE